MIIEYFLHLGNSSKEMFFEIFLNFRATFTPRRKFHAIFGIYSFLVDLKVLIGFALALYPVLRIIKLQFLGGDCCE